MELEFLLGYLHKPNIHMNIGIRIRICGTYLHTHTYVQVVVLN